MRGSESSQRLVAGRYRLEEVLGRGGMGVVWRATDELIGRPVAVKEVRPPPGLPAEDRVLFGERALREARAAGRINHPSVVAIHDVVFATGDDEAVYIVTELVTAPTLAEVLRREGALPAGRVAVMAIRLLDALGAAHAIGVVHRDVKPSNIMVLDGDEVKLVDFGIAHAGEETRLTREGVLGSTGYLAPELFHGASPTPASDLWAVGMTLLHAINGQGPFDGASTAAIIHAVLYGDLPPVRCEPPLATVITGLLVRDPRHRLTGRAAGILLGASPVPSAPESTQGDPVSDDAASGGDSWEKSPTTLRPVAIGPPRRQASAAEHIEAPSDDDAEPPTLAVTSPQPSRPGTRLVLAVQIGLLLWVELLMFDVLLLSDLPGWMLFVYLLLSPLLVAPMFVGLRGPWQGTLRLAPLGLVFENKPPAKSHTLSWEHVNSLGVGRGAGGSRFAVRLAPTVPRIWRTGMQLAGSRRKGDGPGPSWMVGDIAMTPEQVRDRLRAAVPARVPINDLTEGESHEPRVSVRARRVALSIVILAGLVVGGHAYRHEHRVGLAKITDNPVGVLAFSPDGAVLASAGGYGTDITLWDVATKRATAVLSGHRKSVTTLSFSPNGTALASGDEGNEIKLWNVRDHRATATLSFTDADYGDIDQVLFAPNGGSIAAVRLGDVKVWRLAALKQPVAMAEVSSSTKTLRFSADGRLLLGIDRDGARHTWETASGRATDAQVDGVPPWERHEGDQVQVRDSGSGRILATLTNPGYVTAAVLGPEDLLVTGSHEEVRVWSIGTNKTVRALKGGFFDLLDSDFPDADLLALSPDGATVAIAGSQPSGLWLWRFRSNN